MRADFEGFTPAGWGFADATVEVGEGDDDAEPPHAESRTIAETARTPKQRVTLERYRPPACGGSRVGACRGRRRREAAHRAIR
jgi:hypothetical protein